jgi:hypothetical protein
MNSNIFFLLAEYGGIPIGVIGYNFITSKLASPDPLSASTPGHKKIHLPFGLELMQIISVSTLLYGIGHFGHAVGDLYTKENLLLALIAFAISMTEFFIILYLTMKVREWGHLHKKTKIIPNIIATFFWICLAFLIINTSDEAKRTISSNGISKTQNNDSSHLSEIATISDSTNIHLGNLYREIRSPHILLYESLITCLLVGAVIYFIAQRQIKNKKNKILRVYSKGASLMNTDPTLAIRNLQNSLLKTPTDSPLLIDIHMKLARIFRELNEPEKALDQIKSLSQSPAFHKFEYLRVGVLSFQIDLLLHIGRIDEAEKLIDLISNPQTAQRLQLEILAAKAKIPK